VCVVVCKGNFEPSSDDPIAVRMVSDTSIRFAGHRRDDMVLNTKGSSSGSYVELVSVVAVFAGAAVITVISVTAFVAVYVYVEAVRKMLYCHYDYNRVQNDESLCGKKS